MNIDSKAVPCRIVAAQELTYSLSRIMLLINLCVGFEVVFPLYRWNVCTAMTRSPEYLYLQQVAVRDREAVLDAVYFLFSSAFEYRYLYGTEIYARTK